MDLSFLNHLSGTSTRTIALVFFPFNTQVVYYDTVEELLSGYFDIPRESYLRLSVSGHEFMDQVELYVGQPSPIRLDNMARFLRFNSLDVSNIGTSYAMCIVVGRDSLSGMPVDVPLTTFPWVTTFFKESNDTRFFLTFPSEPQVNPHRLISTCSRCQELHCRCVRDGLACSTCTRAGLDCMPGKDEPTKRRRLALAEVRKNISALCALHQYTLNLFLRSHGDQPTRVSTVVALGNFLVATIIPKRNPLLEQSLEFYSDAFQHVSIINGEIRLVREVGMEDLWGFELADFPHKSDRASRMTPHLGLHKVSDAYSLIDAALETPGELFYLDTCILTRGFLAVTARVMALGIVLSSTHVEIMLGWKFPLSD